MLNKPEAEQENSLLKRVDNLEIEVNSLKESNRLLQEVIKALASDHVKDELEDILEPKNVEDDIRQNAEDIVELRVDVGHNQFILTQVIVEAEALNKTFRNDIDQIVLDIDEHNTFVEETRPPVGSVIGWLPVFSESKEPPQGWQRCDGSLITSGPFTGQETPDINNSGRFLRGGMDNLAVQVQEDAVQDHTHLDEGHTHQDAGHTHTDNGHNHIIDTVFGTAKTSPNSKIDFDGTGGYSWEGVYDTHTGNAQITTNSADIQSSRSGMSGIEIGRVSDETRPKSMFVVYIMRIF
jgi:hypothetical protein